jgi:hypothetical protein
MWQDIELWLTERFKILPLKAIKYARFSADPKRIAYHFSVTNTRYAIPISLEELHGRGNTGALAFEFAYALGCRPIILLGFDCKYRGEKTDFFGRNRFHKPHTLSNCSRGLNWIAKQASSVPIINCGDNDIFDKRVSLDDAIDQVKGLYKVTGREALISQLFSRK